MLLLCTVFQKGIWQAKGFYVELYQPKKLDVLENVLF